MKMNRKLAYPAALLVISWAWLSPPQASAQLPSPGSLVVTITSPSSGSTVGGTIPVEASVISNLVVTGVQFKLDGNNLGAQDTAPPYSISWNTTNTNNGWHTLTAVATAIGILPVTSDPVTVNVFNDKTPPAVTINQAAGQADPTNTSPINFTAVFSESVNGFTSADVMISGTAGGTKTVAVTGGPSTYTVAVSGMTAGTVIATIPAGAAQDTAGNGNTASTSTDNTVTFDTTAPTVAITSPSDQEKVSGTIPVSANASDNVGVVSVVFKLDGADPGLEDTTEPYSVLFDTTTTSDGPHTLTAVARDAAGNQTTSASVSVTVSNAPPPQPAPTITSFMPTSGSVGSSVTIKGTNFTGATAVKFNGVSASFMVTSATEIQATVPSGATTGLLSVTTPGGTATSASAFTVEEGPPSDTTPPTVSINQAAGQPDPTNTSPINFTVVFSEPVSDFTAADVTITGTAGGTKTVEVTGGPSTYTVAVSGMTNGTVIATIAAGVAKDAAGNGNTASTSTDNTVTFTTTTDTVTRFEEDNAAISYSPAGAWVQRGPEIAAFSGGIAVSSDVAGATATFTFTGTAVSWIGLKCSVCGIASVSIDGGAATSIDTAGAAAPGSPGLTSEVVFTTSGLADESHTMVITVTGTTTSADAHIIVDAFDVTGTGGGAPPTVTRIEETDPAVSYTGNWFQVCDPRASGGCGEESIEVGAQATLSFTGTGVRWIGWRNEGGGIANVYVDGILKGEVDTYSPTTEPQAEALTASGLPGGPHTLTIEVTGRGRNPATGTWIIIDAFDVTP